jgi:hypothetical protein
MTWFALFLAWEMMHLRRSFFQMQPNSKRLEDTVVDNRDVDDRECENETSHDTKEEELVAPDIPGSPSSSPGR